jgi:predicted enzyme related to lactoylglutathione lyase
VDTPSDIGLVLDCQNPTGLAPFWAAALGYEIAGAVDDYTLLVPNGRPGPKLLLQRVPEAKAGKNRMHFDIHTAEIEQAASQLEAFGGTRISPGVLAEYNSHWIVMADPEGNEFCVCDLGTDAG